MNVKRRMMRITPGHTTTEAITVMNNAERDSVAVADRDTGEQIGTISRATLISKCVRAWHDPARCRVENHLDRACVPES